MSRKIKLAAATACAITLGVTANAQDGAFDSDPYFSKMPPGEQVWANTQPQRATAGQTQQSLAPAPLPRPRSAQIMAAATPGAAAPAAASAARSPIRGPAILEGQTPAARRAITAYVEARTGWDGLRGTRRDDGVLSGFSTGFDGTIAKIAGGRLFAGVFGSIDLSSAKRTQASVERDATGANSVLTLTENPVSETRDLELGARLGWRANRFGLYAMAALTNAKRDTNEVTTVFTELADPDDPDAVIYTQDSVTEAGAMGMFDDGWRVGGGAEARIVGPAYLHVGYRYSNYSGGVEKHQVVTGLGARF